MVRFGDLYALPSRNGLTRPSAARGVGYRMAAMGEIFASDFVGDSEMDRVRLNSRELSAMMLNNNDLLFARQSLVLSGAGKCAIVRDLAEPTTFESHLIRVRLNEQKANPLFYMYYFRSPLSPMKSIVQQGVQAGIRGSDLAELQVHCPDKMIQDKIADILFDYDAAIANCRKQIVLLEEAAMRLYREWFGEGKGEKKRIGDVCECVLGGTPNRAKAEYWGGNVAWINSGKVNELRIVEPSEYITDLGLKKSAAKVMPRHTTVLAITGATLGQVSLLEIDSAANQSVVGVLENDVIHYEFIYPMIVSNIRKLIMHQTGGAQQHICKDDVLNFEVLIPSKSELNKYGNICRPIFERVSNLFFTIRSLTEAQDRLLPKLMKGEIEV